VRALTPTLEAAQKSDTRVPYVEAKVYDQELGIKRLSWARIYIGTEPDGHHGLAFDGNSDLHRVRSDAGSLYRQKVTSPGEGSDFSSWTLVNSDCSGPCAIAARGAKVWVFYVTADEEYLRQYYSTDYGASWTDAALSAWPGATAGTRVHCLCASWWGTTDVVVCFAQRYAELNGIVIDTSTMTATEHPHALTAPQMSDAFNNDAWGIGSTYYDNAIHLVFGAIETDGAEHLYGLYRTEFSDTYHFLAHERFLALYDTQLTKFPFPDCHRPETPYDYETVQITAVERFEGTPNYSLPLLTHLVKGAAFSENTFVEPRPFVNITSTHGLRLQTTDSHWWLERPDGIWLAERVAAGPVDLTPHIVELHQVIRDREPGSLDITLDNSDGQYATPPALGSEVVLKLGYVTTAGNETIEAPHYTLDGWTYESEKGRSTITLHCIDAWGLARNWTARYLLQWNHSAVAPHTVWQILKQVLGRVGVLLVNEPCVPKSATIDSYCPEFEVRPAQNGATQLRRLLMFVTDGLVPREGYMFAKDLLPDEEPCYEYRNEPGHHPILKGTYGEHVATSHTQVSGALEDGSLVRHSAFDWDSLALGLDRFFSQHDPALLDSDHADKRADSLLSALGRRGLQAAITIPTNAGQELYDLITSNTCTGTASHDYRLGALACSYVNRRYECCQAFLARAP
jgi:hypothetical protein